jgi:lipoyl(octanoyl) transferase
MPPTDSTLQVYLLGTVEFEAALALQQRLVYEITGDRSRAALVLCEHPPHLTVGRQGSRGHILFEPEELRARQWSVRWVNRGGGVWLHLPGQLAIYPIFALDRLGLGLDGYLDRLQQVIVALLGDFDIPGRTHLATNGEGRNGFAARDGNGVGTRGVWVGARPIAALGVAVRDWVSYFGAVLNINPALDAFRLVRCLGRDSEPMTSLERERRGRLRPSFVRERLIEHFAAGFQFTQTALFSDHPALSRKARADAVATSS